MSKKKTCPVCGAKMPDEMRFCGSCGADMEQEEQFFADMPRQIRRPDEPRPVETAIRPEKRRGARRSVWQYIIVLVIIAAVIAAAVMLVLKMNQPVTPKEPSETYDTVHVINADGEEIATTAAPEPTSAPEATEPPEATQAPEATEPPEATQAPEATPTPTETTRPYTVTDAGDTVYVTGSGVNLREGPGTNYSILAVLSSGTALKRTGTTDNNWTRVEYQGKEGYLSNAFVSAEEPKGTPAATPAPGDVTPAEDTVIITESANLRTGPGTGYNSVGTLNEGDEVIIHFILKVGDTSWGNIDKGWVCMDYVDLD